MLFESTRGAAPQLDLVGVTLAGLARDGGLYVPVAWPVLDDATMAAMATQSYEDVAFAVMQPFMGDSVADADLKAMIAKAYGGFFHDAVAPLTQLGPNDWLLELYHGPTLAFKDFALQFLGHMFEHVLAREDKRITIVGATSGDTGSAAIDAVKGRDNIRIFMLHPKGRVSEVQRRQMTSVRDANVHNIAIDGTFDDCQALVKALFNDLDFRDAQNLSAVNSINWVRVMAQVVYYFYAASRLGAPAREVAFAVPTGNFGDVFAGYVARRMGLPIARLIIGTNENDILARTMATGEYRVHEPQATISPAMDIQVSSNFERLLFDLYDRDGDAVARAMTELVESGGFGIGENALQATHALFTATRVDTAETLAAIRRVYEQSGKVIDPHTAVGIAAGAKCRDGLDVPLVTLATAHPAKFPDAVNDAIGVVPRLPARLADLFDREERVLELANDADALKRHIMNEDW